jgi:formylglycine-generating enzyme required for sulfatase activity
MRFCFVPAGPFVMGSDDEVLRYTSDYHEDIQPVRHENAVGYDYWMGQYPVTNAQYARFVAAGGYDNASYWPEATAAGLWREGVVTGFYWNGDKYVQGTGRRAYDYGDPFNLPNHPVVGVSWYEALAFCRWLEETLRAQSAFPEGWRVQLPNELEWEKAARGGVQIPEKTLVYAVADGFAATETGQIVDNPLPERVFPWGATFDGEKANRELDTTSAVGAFPRGTSPYGVQELSGNVFEWTRSLWGHYDRESKKFDLIHTYPYVADDGREQLGADYYHPRTVRGGCWGVAEKWQRCAARNWVVPDFRYDDRGFRIVLSPLSASDL